MLVLSRLSRVEAPALAFLLGDGNLLRQRVWRGTLSQLESLGLHYPCELLVESVRALEDWVSVLPQGLRNLDHFS